MKRSLTFFLFLCILVGATLADSPLGNVEDLIQDGLFRHSEEIRKLSGDLTDTDKLYLLGKYKQNAQIPGLANLAIGLGIGSFMQGDTKGGLLGVAGDLLGIGLFVGFYISYGHSVQLNLAGQDDPGYLALAFAASSLVVITGNRAIQLGRAISYANRYNEALKDSIRF